MVQFKVPEPEAILAQYARAAEASNGALSAEELAATFVRKRDLPGHPEAFAKVMKHMTDPVTRQRYNTLRRLPLIKVPTLVIWGRDDAVNSLDEVGMPTANAIPGARLIVYENTGHAVPVEQPERFPRDVVEFLLA
jgi:pimeloyl-ACP methyl ester carboxylesterase